MKDLMATIRTLAWVALIAAVYQELRKAPEERTWHGKVGGVIPYDLRFPTVERVKAAYWDPDSDHILTERVIGVGWGVNIPVLLRRLDDLSRQYSGVASTVREEISKRVPSSSGRRSNGHDGGRA